MSEYTEKTRSSGYNNRGQRSVAGVKLDIVNITQYAPVFDTDNLLISQIGDSAAHIPHSLYCSTRKYMRLLIVLVFKYVFGFFFAFLAVGLRLGLLLNFYAEILPFLNILVGMLGIIWVNNILLD